MSLPVEKILFDPANAGNPWGHIDDRVMGGVSSSSMRLEGEIAVFAGRVSLENNGGFASVRSAPERHDLSAFRGIRLRVKGDGKVYSLRLRTTSAFDGVSYESRFRTRQGEWQNIELPFSTFRPVFRGRELDEYPRLDPAEIRTLGFLISDRQEGPFRLEIAWIRAFRG